MITFDQVLKQTRRNTYIYGSDWRALIVCPTASAMACAWDEARHLIEASSLKLEEAKYVTRTLRLERGALIRFIVVGEVFDVHRIAATEWTQIAMLAYDKGYPTGVTEFLRRRLRSAEVPSEALLFAEQVSL